MAIEVANGKDATIHFNAQKCIHSRGCVLSHPDVFVPNVTGAWIHPDAQPVDELVRVAQNCPSGAITVVRRSTGNTLTDSNERPIVNTLRVRENGPLAVEATLLVSGQQQANPRATLCRCGQSKNKPFCDGSHGATAFVATGEPATVTFTAMDVRNGPLDVRPLPNGPLHVVGNLELVSGTGRTCNKLSEAYLCRCGQSKNKPYCDGSHTAAGFEAS